MKIFFTIVLFACSIMPSMAQDVKSKDAQIKTLMVKNQNLEIEVLFHKLSEAQKDGQAQIDKLATQVNAQLAVFQTKLSEAMEKAKKDQNIPENYSYNANTHKWDPPAPVKAPDGSPVAKPENKPESKK